LRILFKEQDRAACYGQADGGCQTTDAGPDDDDALAAELSDDKPRWMDGN
jgi:hypothetical protein